VCRAYQQDHIKKFKGGELRDSRPPWMNRLWLESPQIKLQVCVVCLSRELLTLSSR
jgi:hypothetical protein